jgi:hypothetical protein
MIAQGDGKGNKSYYSLACSISTVVSHSCNRPMVEGLSPAPSDCTGKEKIT